MAGYRLLGAEIALSWLGLGVDPSTPSFGSMIQNGAGGVRTFEAYPPSPPRVRYPHHSSSSSPGNLLGDALVDIVEPRYVPALRCKEWIPYTRSAEARRPGEGSLSNGSQRVVCS